MNEEEERKRLLKCIEIDKYFDENKFNIELKNIGIKFLNIINGLEGLRILSDIIMDPEEVTKYDDNSEILISCTAYNKNNDILDNRDYTIRFKEHDGITFKGTKTIEQSLSDFYIADVDKIKIKIDANLNETKNMSELRKKILNSVERDIELERKFDIEIKNIGLKFYEILNKLELRFFIEVSVNLSDWEYIEFSSVLYDENNHIIDTDIIRLYSEGFIGSTLITSSSFEYHDNIKKIKIHPNKIK